jgi:hypothetical protein
VTAGVDVDRRASSVIVSSDTGDVLAAVSVGYTQAKWRDAYEGMLDGLKGTNYVRLGIGWWTTFETIGPLEIGGARVEAGTYYLGVAVDKGGAFSLLLFDSAQAMKRGLLPPTTALYAGEVKAQFVAPLTFARNSRDAAVPLEVEITADKKSPETGNFAVRWGRHTLSAPVKLRVTLANAAAVPKK